MSSSLRESDFVPHRHPHQRTSESSRTMASSSSNPTPPAERAAEIVDKLPSHPSLITKTGTAILGSGLLATAISQELYVFNEETVIAVGYLILFGYIAKVCVFFRRYPELLLFFLKKTYRDYRSSACLTKNGQRTTLRASRACLRVPALSTRRPCRTASMQLDK